MASVGGRFALKDNGETPDTQDALFEFGGFTAAWSHREAAAGRARRLVARVLRHEGEPVDLAQRLCDHARQGDPPGKRRAAVHRRPAGRRRPSATREPARSEALDHEPCEDKTGDSLDQFRRHVRNFLDCVKSRQPPVSDLESAHRVSTTCHLANLSLRLGRKPEWDAEREDHRRRRRSRAQLIRPYRAPWDRELKAVIG